MIKPMNPFWGKFVFKYINLRCQSFVRESTQQDVDESIHAPIQHVLWDSIYDTLKLIEESSLH